MLFLNIHKKVLFAKILIAWPVFRMYPNPTKKELIPGSSEEDHFRDSRSWFRIEIFIFLMPTTPFCWRWHCTSRTLFMFIWVWLCLSNRQRVEVGNRESSKQIPVWEPQKYFESSTPWTITRALGRACIYPNNPSIPLAQFQPDSNVHLPAAAVAGEHPCFAQSEKIKDWEHPQRAGRDTHWCAPSEAHSFLSKSCRTSFFLLLLCWLIRVCWTLFISTHAVVVRRIILRLCRWTPLGRIKAAIGTL